MGQKKHLPLSQWALVIGVCLTLVGVLGAHLAPPETRREAAIASSSDLNAQLADGPAPDFEVKLHDGKPLRLSDLRGKVVFVNFWATWCEPCRKEIPDLERLTKEMEGLPFAILAVSSDESFDDIRRLFGQKESNMIIGLDVGGQAIAAQYGTEKLPETYVVDQNGQLRLRFINAQPWTDERIHRYLEWLATNP
jgi:thiol-disulfide isomerase/thioredoxin